MTDELANEVIEMLVEKISSKKNLKMEWSYEWHSDRFVVIPVMREELHCSLFMHSLFARMPGTSSYDWIDIVRACKTKKEYEHMKRCKTYAKWFIENILEKSMKGNDVFICTRDDDILFLKRNTSLEHLLIEYDMWAARKNAEKQEKKTKKIDA